MGFVSRVASGRRRTFLLLRFAPAPAALLLAVFSLSCPTKQEDALRVYWGMKDSVEIVIFTALSSCDTPYRATYDSLRLREAELRAEKADLDRQWEAIPPGTKLGHRRYGSSTFIPEPHLKEYYDQLSAHNAGWEDLRSRERKLAVQRGSLVTSPSVARLWADRDSIIAHTASLERDIARHERSPLGILKTIGTVILGIVIVAVFALLILGGI